MDKKFEIKEATLNAVLQYLGKQPYADVAQLIAGLINECNSQILPASKEPEV